MTARLATLACALVGCGGPGLRGAIAVEAGREPHATEPRQVLVPTDCRDRRGAPARVASEFWLVRTEDHEVLVEARTGFSSIVVTNRLDLPGAETAFQFVADDGDGPSLLHDVRFVGSDRARAKLTVTDTFGECSMGGDRTLAIPGPALVSCRLDTRKTLE